MTVQELSHLEPISNATVDALVKSATLVDPNSCILCGEPAPICGVFVNEAAVREQRSLQDSDPIVYGLCPYCFLLPDKAGRVEERLGL
jgi:hypothetical protein